jgi:hypothetical protein
VGRGVLVAAVALGLVNALWGISGLSWFGDEVFSIDVAREPFGDPMLDRLRATEVAPPAYYAALHGWIEVTGAARELALRLPSVLAAAGLVVMTWAIALRVGTRRAAAVAAVLVAVSPLVLTYAQQVRAYAPAMLLVAAAALAALRGRTWVATALCVAAVWTHYTALPVVAAIVAWSVLNAPRGSRERWLQPVVVGVAALVLAPLAREQFDRGSEDHAGAALSGRTLLEVLGTPFDGRDLAPIGLVAAGALVVAIAVAAAAVAARRASLGGAGGARRGLSAHPPALLLACGAGPVLLFLVLGLAGADVLWSRYTAVAAPFLVVLVALLVDARSRALQAVAVAAVVLAVVGSARLHGRPGELPMTGPLIEAVDDGWREGDVLVLTLNETVNASLQHYARRDLPPGAELAAPAPETFRRPGARLWVVTPILTREQLAPYLPPGASITSTEVFDAAAPLQLTLVTT